MTTLQYSASGQVGRDAGFEREGRDCTVKALTAATGVPYRDAHAFMASQGRQNGHGAYMSTMLPNWARNKTIIFGYRVTQVEIGGQIDYRTAGWILPTLAKVFKQCKDGRYIIIKPHHALAVVNGVIFDSQSLSGARSRVLGCYKFEPSSIVEAREAKAAAELAAGYARYDACKAVNNGGF